MTASYFALGLPRTGSLFKREPDRMKTSFSPWSSPVEAGDLISQRTSAIWPTFLPTDLHRPLPSFTYGLRRPVAAIGPEADPFQCGFSHLACLQPANSRHNRMC